MAKRRRWLDAVAIALLAAFNPYTAAAASVISVDPANYIPTPPPYVGSTVFVVPIEISGAADLTFWQFDLLYDATDVQINTSCDPFSDPFCSLFTGPVTEGPFFQSLSPFNVFNPGFILLDGITSEQLGNLIAVNGTFAGSLPGPSGDGILAYVEFITTANGTGQSPITVTNVSTTSSAAPEPTTLALLVVALALLRSRRSVRRERLG